jgi:hypothetical protein
MISKDLMFDFKEIITEVEVIIPKINNITF